MSLGGNVEILWELFDHVKCSKGWMTILCHVHDNKCYNVLAHDCMSWHAIWRWSNATLIWGNLNVVMSDKGVPKMISDEARTFYGSTNPISLIKKWKRTCLFHRLAYHDKVTENTSNIHCGFNTNKYAMTTRTRKQWAPLKLNIMWFNHDGCLLELPHKEACWDFQSA